MIDIYSKVDDLQCTEHFREAGELKEVLRDVTNKFLDNLDTSEVSYEWLSSYQIAFYPEDGEEVDEWTGSDYECELDDLLSEAYDEFLEELEEEEDEEEDEEW